MSLHIAALYPNLWANDGLVMSEAFAAATVAATILLAYRLARAPSLARAAAGGGACGLAMLSRSELALLVPLVVLPVLLGLAMYWPLVPVAIFGAVLVRRRGVPLLPLLGPVVLVVVVTAGGRDGAFTRCADASLPAQCPA